MNSTSLNPFAPILALIACITLVSISLGQENASKKAQTPTPTVMDKSSATTAEKKPEPEFTTQPDLAYGAYQRGYYLTAFKLALPRAQLGDPAAQTLIAEIYEKGLGVKRDIKEAIEWYKIAANSGSHEAQFAYAVQLLKGEHVKKDRKTAGELLKKAADSGHPSAQFNYAQLLMETRPTSKGLTLAVTYYEKSASAGIADAYFALAQLYSHGFGLTPADDIKARHYLVKASQNGIDNAQIELGIWLANGRGGEKDLKAALSWFKRAAMAGNTIAQNRLARMIALGLGGDKNPLEAAKWYLLARRSGHKDALLNDFYTALDPEIQQKALEAANRWPAG